MFSPVHHCTCGFASNGKPFKNCAHLDLLTVDQLITGTIAQLNIIKEDILHVSYMMMDLDETMQSINVMNIA